mmetsp:Transcript_8924/g.40547  ORF Transcript_8924/g.40547 Transcript_8924/m.40547 type:complete len:225 (+) Transcript_8924:1129-1803(+)
MATTPAGPISLSLRSIPTHTAAREEETESEGESTDTSSPRRDRARANASSSSSPRRRSAHRPPFSTHSRVASRTKSARLFTRRYPSSAAIDADVTRGLFASAISFSGHPPRVDMAAARTSTPRSERSLDRRLMDSSDGDAFGFASAAASVSAAESSSPQFQRLSLLSRTARWLSARASGTIPAPSEMGSSSPLSGMSLAATPVSAMCTPSRGLSTRHSSSTAHL